MVVCGYHDCRDRGWDPRTRKGRRDILPGNCLEFEIFHDAAGLGQRLFSHIMKNSVILCSKITNIVQFVYLPRQTGTEAMPITELSQFSFELPQA